MPGNASESKTELRRQVRALLERLDATGRGAASAHVCELLKKQDVWNRAQSVLFYAPLPEELDIWPLTREALAAGKIVGLLRFDSFQHSYAACRIRNTDNDLRAGRYGIREPNEHCPALPLRQLDLILVPGMAFDLQGRRLGRGKGIYDRLLSLVRGETCGVAFDEQIVPEVPIEPHDLPVKSVLTPTRWVKC